MLPASWVFKERFEFAWIRKLCNERACVLCDVAQASSRTSLHFKTDFVSVDELDGLEVSMLATSLNAGR